MKTAKTGQKGISDALLRHNFFKSRASNSFFFSQHQTAIKMLWAKLLDKSLNWATRMHNTHDLAWHCWLQWSKIALESWRCIVWRSWCDLSDEMGVGWGRDAGTLPGFRPGGGQLGAGPGYTPTKNRKLLGFGPLFFGSGPMYFFIFFFYYKIVFYFSAQGGHGPLAPPPLATSLKGWRPHWRMVLELSLLNCNDEWWKHGCISVGIIQSFAPTQVIWLLNNSLLPTAYVKYFSKSLSWDIFWCCANFHYFYKQCLTCSPSSCHLLCSSALASLFLPCSSALTSLFIIVVEYFPGLLHRGTTLASTRRKKLTL